MTWSKLITISEHYSEIDMRRATVFKFPDGGYRVVVFNDSGTSFSVLFDKVEDAEDYAEEWVL